eukprot:TRINITY_DN9767_c0_g1_i1.p1 TRINITY_DN9767_c0_g1~~TRINITY_DN9767_c0_g1_i1.p1  ORF type:complete len:103 (+),score=14.02 TRINITY_DN9767_c0_g1_i1:103-411(+)
MKKRVQENNVFQATVRQPNVLTSTRLALCKKCTLVLSRKPHGLLGVQDFLGVSRASKDASGHPKKLQGLLGGLRAYQDAPLKAILFLEAHIPFLSGPPLLGT